MTLAACTGSRSQSKSTLAASSGAGLASSVYCATAASQSSTGALLKGTTRSADTACAAMAADAFRPEAAVKTSVRRLALTSLRVLLKSAPRSSVW